VSAAAPAHLLSAARVVEELLGEVYPEHRWVVHVRELDAADRTGVAAARPGVDQPGPRGDDADTVLERDDPAAAAGAPHDDGFDEAA
jgi:hypothetical protein